MTSLRLLVAFLISYCESLLSFSLCKILFYNRILLSLFSCMYIFPLFRIPFVNMCNFYSVSFFRCHSDLGIPVVWVPRTQIPSDMGIPFQNGCRVLGIPRYPPHVPKSLVIWVPLKQNFAGNIENT